MKFSFLTFFLLSALALNAFGAETYALKSTKIELEVPKTWQKSPNFLQNPLTLFGPIYDPKADSKNTKRAAWIFSDTPKGNENLNKKKLEEKQDNYFSGRLKWMAKRGATLVDKIPYNVFKTKQRVEVHQIGIVYRLGNKTYTEESLFFLCSDSLINITRLTPEDDKTKLQADYQTLMNSLNCIRN